MPETFPEPGTSSDRAIGTLVSLGFGDSASLFERVGDELASAMLARYDQVIRNLLPRFDGREIEKSRRFLFLFERPIDAVRYGLAVHDAACRLGATLDQPLPCRIGIHLGEVFLRHNPAEHMARGAKPLEVEGPSRTAVTRLMSLADDRQTLLTQAAFDLAHRAAVGDASFADDVVWLSHGSYRFTGTEEVIEVFEVGAPGVAPLAAPRPLLAVESRRATGVVRQAAEAWSPAPGEPIPHRPNWMLERRLGEATYGEVWLGKHRKTGDRQAFRFCFDTGDLPRMKHQLAVIRHLRGELGDRAVAPRTLDGQLDEVPYFLESEHAASSTLAAWSEDRGGLAEVPLETRLELAARLAELVAAVHGAGVAVNHLQPLNVLIRERRASGLEVLIADLSRSRILARDLPADLRHLLWRAQRESGLAGYQAPELEDPSSADPKSDLYALGVLLYQLVTADLGRFPGPFWERDVADKLLREQIARLIDPDPRIRAGDASEVARNLRDLDFRRSRPATERQPQPAEEDQGRRRGLLGGLLRRR